MGKILLLIGCIVLSGVEARAQNNQSLEPDFSAMIQWLTQQTAQGLAFNSGSTFDPPNEMRPWRIQPDISLGVGVMPYDKSAFPVLQVKSLAEKNPKADFPDDVKFPNLTVHSRIGLPGRMDLGVRFVNMTVPKNYQLSPTTIGNGQSNTLGIGLRRHFMGGRKPLLTLGAAYNRVSGYFNFQSKLDNVELVPGLFTASSVNNGQMDWNVTSIGVNLVVSQNYGKWTPFLGMGYNRISGVVDGRLEAVWATPLIASTVGKASSRPEPDNTRLILGFQRDGSFFRYFMNTEIKATGFQAGKAFVVSTGLAAPFKIGANSSVVRYGRNKPANYIATKTEDGVKQKRWFTRQKQKKTTTKHAAKKSSHQESLFKRYWNWGKDKKALKSRSASRLQYVRPDELEIGEMIFIR